MKCPECTKESEVSRVYPNSGGTTLMGYNEFYDEAGHYHFHDPNSTSTFYQCSRGHQWADSHSSHCWCGWPDAEESS